MTNNGRNDEENTKTKGDRKGLFIRIACDVRKSDRAEAAYNELKRKLKGDSDIIKALEAEGDKAKWNTIKEFMIKQKV